MPRKPRIHYTETDKALMWDRWRKGESLESIAQLFDRTHGSIAASLNRAPSTVSREINRLGAFIAASDPRRNSARRTTWIEESVRSRNGLFKKHDSKNEIKHEWCWATQDGQETFLLISLYFGVDFPVATIPRSKRWWHPDSYLQQ